MPSITGQQPRPQGCANPEIGKFKGSTPFELFTGMQVSAEIRHYHTFGCPIYLLAKSLQQGKLLAVWTARACVGINLGVSPTQCEKCYAGAKSKNRTSLTTVSCEA
jgi:hypothetical protein